MTQFPLNHVNNPRCSNSDAEGRVGPGRSSKGMDKGKSGASNSGHDGSSSSTSYGKGKSSKGSSSGQDGVNSASFGKGKSGIVPTVARADAVQAACVVVQSLSRRQIK